jgi:hypothetical protein
MPIQCQRKVMLVLRTSSLVLRALLFQFCPFLCLLSISLLILRTSSFGLRTLFL